MAVFVFLFHFKNISINCCNKKMIHMYAVEPGEHVLLVARAASASTSADALQGLRDSLVKNVGDKGKVDFELVDRIEDGSVQLDNAKYDRILASPVDSTIVEHSSKLLGSFLSTLKPNGRILFQELIITDSSPKNDNIPITRTKDTLAQDLKFSGFVNPLVLHYPASAAEVKDVAKNVWNIPDLQLANGFEMAYVVANKSEHDVGAASAISFGKKLKSKTTGPKKAWMINVKEEGEEEIEDQDDLLLEEDLAKPDAASLARPDGVKPKRKACKNCTCGLADGLDVDEDAACKPKMTPKKPVDVVNVKSACGNCSLGDAFRCSSCPYLGMPAFKPGEKVTLGGSMLHDDFMP